MLGAVGHSQHPVRVQIQPRLLVFLAAGPSHSFRALGTQHRPRGAVKTSKYLFFEESGEGDKGAVLPERSTQCHRALNPPDFKQERYQTPLPHI